MRFLTKLALAMVLPAFAPVEPFPPLATVTYTAAASAWTNCPAPKVIDGDTIRCGSERVRLLAIDAPELNGCPRNRRCVPGDGYASRLSLGQALSAGAVRCMTVKRDRENGRTEQRPPPLLIRPADLQRLQREILHCNGARQCLLSTQSGN